MSLHRGTVTAPCRHTEEQLQHRVPAPARRTVYSGGTTHVSYVWLSDQLSRWFPPVTCRPNCPGVVTVLTGYSEYRHNYISNSIQRHGPNKHRKTERQRRYQAVCSRRHNHSMPRCCGFRVEWSGAARHAVIRGSMLDQRRTPCCDQAQPPRQAHTAIPGRPPLSVPQRVLTEHRTVVGGRGSCCHALQGCRAACM